MSSKAVDVHLRSAEELVSIEHIESEDCYWKGEEDVVESLHRRFSKSIYFRVVVVTRTSLYRAILS